MASSYTKRGVIRVATDLSMAVVLSSPSSQFRGVLMALLEQVAAGIISANPAIIAAAQAAAGPAVAAQLDTVGLIVGIPKTPTPTSTRTSLPISWQSRTGAVAYPATYGVNYPSAVWSDQGRYGGEVPLLDGSGRMMPGHMPTGVVFADGTVPMSEVLIGQSVRLRQVSGARGGRLEFTSRLFGEENRPYMEVNAADWDLYGDVTAGYQVHVRGNGSTPKSGSRVYWFLEAHGLGHTQNGDPKYEGWYGMGVANRANGETPDGMGRAFLIGGGGRGALGFPFAQPYVELLKNTAFMADDRARPAWGDGVGQNHVAQTPGTIHSGDLLNFRREGHLGQRLLSVGNVPDEASRLFVSRARGTVLSPQNVQAGDALGGLDAGTVTGIFGDYVHVNDNGTGPNNRKRITARVQAVAKENFTPGSVEGTRLDMEVTPSGANFRVVGLSVDEPSAFNETSILIRVNRGGAVTQHRVEIGDINSGGTGYRALRIAN